MGLSSGFWLWPEIWLRFCDFFSAGPLFFLKLGQWPLGGGVQPAAGAGPAAPSADNDGDDEHRARTRLPAIVSTSMHVQRFP